MRIAETPLWTPVASLALAMAWLLPNAHPPWSAFHKDVYLAFVLTIVSYPVLVQACRRHVDSHLDWLSVYLISLSLLILIQGASHKVSFIGQTFVGAVYFFAAGFALYIGRLWAELSPGHIERFLFAAFVVAGIFCAGIIFAQWAQIEMHPVWFSYLPPGERPYGNLNQPNNAGSLLLLALISLTHLMLVGRLRLAIYVFSACFFIGAMVLTASRITFFSFHGVLILGAVLAFRLPRFHSYRWLPLGLFVIFWAIFLGHQYGWGEAAEHVNPLKRELAGTRMAAYSAFGEAILHGPLWGFGFDQAVKAQLFAGSLGHKLPGLFGWTHNFVLDIAVWFGWPIAFLGVLLGVWSIFQFRRLRFSPTIVASIACVLVLLVHGMVELPLAYAYFLLPVCLLIGALFGHAAIPATRISLITPGVWLLCLSLALGALWADYLRVEAAFTTWRFKAARVGTLPERIETDFLILDQFGVLIEGLDADPSKRIAFDLPRFRSAVLSFPSPYALLRLVLLQAKNGDFEGAKQSVVLARLVTTSDTNQDMSAQWKEWQKIDADVAKIEWGTE